nr:MAG: hypothetical protein [Botourmiaviridae sp.]
MGCFKRSAPCDSQKAFRAVAQNSEANSDNLVEPFVLLETMAGILGKHYDVPLPVPRLLSQDSGPTNIKKGKEFSVGLLENPVDHEWYGPEFRRLCLRERLSISGSLFLWRKTLPSVAASPEVHRARVTAPEIPLPAGYVPHICQMVREMFPRGWDKGYFNQVDVATPTIKSVLEKGRGKGGWRSTGPDREEYGLACMGETELLSGENSCKVRYMDAACDGKSRAVTVMSADAQVLKPLHKLVYDRISQFPWLLRGKAKPNRFRDFTRVPGEVFVSGDYESATDHLPVSSAEWILRTILKNCTYVPEAVQVAALRYLRVTMMYPDGSEVETTRQLMGSLLCFPLLCIQNYLAFRWVFGPDTPVRVNGDDIVFRCTREKYEEWAGFVSSVGLRLSPGKTLVSSSSFSLNSTFFTASDSSVRLVPVVRCTTMLRSKAPYPTALSGSLRGFLEGWRGDVRDDLGAWFLRGKSKVIRKSGRSVLRGLGVGATHRMLQDSGFWRRELWYLNSVPARYKKNFTALEGVPLPLPPDRLQGQVKLPSGWRRVDVSSVPSERALQRASERDFWDSVTELAWGSSYSPRSVSKQYWSELESSGFERQYHHWTQLDSRRKPGLFKMLGTFGLKGGKSRLRSKPLWRQLSLPIVRRKETVWVRGEDEEQEQMPSPADYMKEMVQRKIVLVRSFETPYRTRCSERWLREEELLTGYVQ